MRWLALVLLTFFAAPVFSQPTVAQTNCQIIGNQAQDRLVASARLADRAGHAGPPQFPEAS